MHGSPGESGGSPATTPALALAAGALEALPAALAGGPAANADEAGDVDEDSAVVAELAALADPMGTAIDATAEALAFADGASELLRPRQAMSPHAATTSTAEARLTAAEGLVCA